MSDKYRYTQFNATGQVTNDAGSLELVPVKGADTYVNIERLSISIVKAAVGGGGVVKVQDTDGNFVYSVNADGVKDVSFDWGDEGCRFGPNVGLVALTCDAGGTQAEASVAVSGHYSLR